MVNQLPAKMVEVRKLMFRLKEVPQNQGPYQNLICKRKKNGRGRLLWFDLFD
jgi:hypothetical protein